MISYTIIPLLNRVDDVVRDDVLLFKVDVEGTVEHTLYLPTPIYIIFIFSFSLVMVIQDTK